MIYCGGIFRNHSIGYMKQPGFLLAPIAFTALLFPQAFSLFSQFFIRAHGTVRHSTAPAQSACRPCACDWRATVPCGMGGTDDLAGESRAPIPNARRSEEHTSELQ